MHLSPPPLWLRLLSVLRRWLCCCWFLFIVTPIVGVCNCSMFCCMLLYVHSSIAIIWMGKRELVALLNLSSWCLVMVEWLFLAVPWGCVRFVIVVFPDHTHYFCLRDDQSKWFSWIRTSLVRLFGCAAWPAYSLVTNSKGQASTWHALYQK